jgi:hypothetical protein
MERINSRVSETPRSTVALKSLINKIWGYHGGDYEECRLLGYKTPQIVPHRKYFVSARIQTEVFMAVTMENAVFWDVLPHVSCKNRCFGAT